MNLAASNIDATSAQSKVTRLAAATAASDAREWRRAAELWDGLRTDFPQDARCWHKTGEAYCHAGMFEQADRILDQAIASFPDDDWAAYWSIVVARRQADWPEALQRAEKMRQAFPDSWRPLIEAAEALAALARPAESEELRRAALKRFPDEFWTNYGVARLDAERSDPPGAVRIWSELAARFPARPAAIDALRAAEHRLANTQTAADDAAAPLHLQSLGLSASGKADDGTVDPIRLPPASGKAEAVRLVIWDLDETFWRGTLTEGGIDYSEDNHKIVIELARRGIMSSICSKNDHAAVRAILEERGLWDYFIFPSIRWDAKGPRISALIEAVQLRPESVLFIDDNPLNLNEALYFVPNLQVTEPAAISGILTDPRFKGKDDSALSRLGQYKLLEQRKADEVAAGGNNIEFLRSSNIRIYIEHDIETHVDRAIELINRTNQLNFTKRRLADDMEAARQEFAKLLHRPFVQAGLVRVIDNYGDPAYHRASANLRRR
jgi:FkbH-like protein